MCLREEEERQEIEERREDGWEGERRRRMLQKAPFEEKRERERERASNRPSGEDRVNRHHARTEELKTKRNKNGFGLKEFRSF